MESYIGHGGQFLFPFLFGKDLQVIFSTEFFIIINFYHNFRWTKVLKLASKAELQNLDEDLESSQNKADLKRNSSFTSSTSTTNSIQSAD